jgi:catechol 2,3-dioxygenase-like lactoylglutathione lyase family enzyme
MSAVGPVYEAIIGVKDLAAAERYWAEMGYRPVAHGELDAATAEQLYGWPRAARALRLQNGETAEYSLVRLLEWEELRPGRAADFPPISLAMRWSAALVDGVVDLYDSFLEGAAAGEPWQVNRLVRGWMGPPDEPPGFFRRPIVMREFLVTGPETRQVFFGRTGFTRPGYGRVWPSSPRGVSPFTHHGVVLPAEQSLSWFCDVLGLERRGGRELSDQQEGARTHLELRPGQRVLYTQLGAPGFPEGLLFVFQPLAPAPDARNVCRPGGQGVTLFSFRTGDLAGVLAASQALGGQVTPICRNEFGEPAAGVVLPAGVWWQLIGTAGHPSE